MAKKKAEEFNIANAESQRDKTISKMSLSPLSKNT